MVEEFADRHLDLVSRLELPKSAAGVRPPFDCASFAGPAEVKYEGIAEPLFGAIDSGQESADMQRFVQNSFWALARAQPIAHSFESEWPLSVDLRLIITTLLPRSL